MQNAVFVVDDDPDFLAVLGQVLEDAGVRAVLFSNAESLLDALESERPSLVLSDFVMPGLSGAQLVDILRRDERWRDIPVVVMTGSNDTSLPLRVDVPVVYKPDMDTLLGTITSLAS